MQISHATLDGLRVTFSLIYEKAYSDTPVWSPKLATESPSTTATNEYGWIAQQVKLREWLGPRVAQNLAEHRYTLRNKKFEGTVRVSRDDIEDDNLGMYKSMHIPQLAQAAKKHPDELLAALLTANPTAFDGKALFASDHPTYDKAGTTYDNDYSLDLDATNFNTVWSAMSAYTGEDGNPIGVTPNLLVVGPLLKKAALELMQSTTIVQTIQNVAGSENVGAAAVENMLKGWADVLVIPELSGTKWYLADVTKPVKPFIHQTRTSPEFVSQEDPQSARVFELDEFTYGVRVRRAMGVSLPFLIARGKSS